MVYMPSIGKKILGRRKIKIYNNIGENVGFMRIETMKNFTLLDYICIEKLHRGNGYAKNALLELVKSCKLLIGDSSYESYMFFVKIGAEFDDIKSEEDLELLSDSQLPLNFTFKCQDLNGVAV